MKSICHSIFIHTVRENDVKIAVVFDGLGVGGIERVGIDYIKLLSGSGHEIVVYNLNPSANEMESELDQSIEIRRIRFPRKICPEMYVVLVKRFWWGKYAYLPAHIGLNIFLLFHRLIKKSRMDKYDFAVAFSGHFNDLTFVEKGYVKADHKICWLHGGIQDYALLSSGFLMLYQKIRNLVTLSSFCQDSVLNLNPNLRHLNIKKIYNPTFIGERAVDHTVVDSLRKEYGDFILMVGRMTKEKDHRTVIRAGKLLRDKYGIDNKILFLGDGKEQCNLEEYVKDMDMQGQIFFMGNRMDVQNYYAAAKLLVHSSPAEGLPTVLLEAMYFGLPIVATNSLPGVPEILENDKDGLVCPVGDQDKMAEYIYLLLSDSELYKVYSDRGKSRITAFRPETVQGQLEDFFSDIKKGN